MCPVKVDTPEGTLANIIGTPSTTRRKKRNLYFTFEFRNCLDLFSAPIGLRTCSSYICNASVQLQLSRRRSRSPKYSELSYFTLLLCRGRQRNEPKIYNASAGCVLSAVAFVVCLSSLLWRERGLSCEKFLHVIRRVSPCQHVLVTSYLLLIDLHMANTSTTMRSSGFNKLELCSYADILLQK